MPIKHWFGKNRTPRNVNITYSYSSERGRKENSKKCGFIIFIILFRFRNTCTQFYEPHWQYTVTLDKKITKSMLIHAFLFNCCNLYWSQQRRLWILYNKVGFKHQLFSVARKGVMFQNLLIAWNFNIFLPEIKLCCTSPYFQYLDWIQDCFHYIYMQLWYLTYLSTFLYIYR